MTGPTPPVDTKPNRDARPLGRLVVYWFPLFLGTVVLFVYGAGERGRYEDSLFLVQKAIHFLTPDLPYQPNSGGLVTEWSMYQINEAFRRLAHVGQYAVLTFLIVRTIQQGNTRLKPASIIAAIVGSAIYVAADEMKRSHEAHRHAKSEDIVLNAVGIGITLCGTLLFFALKALERRLATPEAVPPEPAATVADGVDAEGAVVEDFSPIPPGDEARNPLQ